MRKFRVRATVVLAGEQEWQYEIYAKDEEEAMKNIKEENFENVVHSVKLWDTIANEDEEILEITISDVEEAMI